jgi:hypothetical protein
MPSGRTGEAMDHLASNKKEQAREEIDLHSR